MKNKIQLVIILFLWLFSGVAVAQTTEGTEFWVTFMNNFKEDPYAGGELKLIVSSRQDATVTVSNPRTSWSTTFNVKANQIANQVVPEEQCYTEGAEKVENHGLVVSSTKPISLYAANYRPHTYDATIVLPTKALGEEYIIQTFEDITRSYLMKEFAVVATEDGTQVTITPHARTSKGQAKDVPFQVTLDRGQTYQVMSVDASSDFTGTQVQTNRPIAVFAGHQCAFVPTGIWACDHLVEQSMPVKQWGKAFVVTSTYGQYGDRVAVTARYDNTEVKVNGSTVTTLAALQTYEFRLTVPSVYIETTQPAACYKYLEGAVANNERGDPASVHISPVEQRIQEITFATFQTDESRQHYVNVVTTEAGAAAMTLDGRNISSEFAAVTGNSQLRFAQVSIRYGTHTLRTSADGFTGHVYGLGWCESYAYSFGSSAIDLESSILVNGKPNDERERCYLEPIVFTPQANLEYTSVLWKFGDGQSSSESTVTHTYAAPGDYDVSLIVTNGADKDTSYTTLHLIDIIRDTLTAVICDGEKYTFAGKDYKASGVYTATFKSAGGCDSIVTLDLKVQPTFKTEESATVPNGLSYRWHWKWYKEKGDYTDTLTSVNGCDSIITLHLDVVEQMQDMYDTICYRSTYNFMDYDYDLPAIDDYRDQQYVDYTLEYRDLESCLNYRMHLAIIPQVNGEDVVLYDTIMHGTTYDFFGEPLTLAGTYTTTAEGASGCMLNYTLHLVVLPVPIHENYAELCHEDSYTFLDKVYTEAGQYLDTVWEVTGIKSIERLTLKDKRAHTELTITDVDYFELGDKIITQSGTYRDTLTAENGCDSIVVLNLKVKHECKYSSEESVTICEGETYRWRDIVVDKAGIYTSTFMRSEEECDSLFILHLNYDTEQMINQRWNDFLSVSKAAYDKYGGFTDYQWYRDGMPLAGETSSQLYLPDEGLNPSSGYSVEMTRLSDGVRFRTCSYYPVVQPNTATLSVMPTVVSSASDAPLRIRTPRKGEARLYNQTGTHIATWQLEEGNNTCLMNAVRGLYIVCIQTENGEQFTRKIIVE